MVLEPLVTGLQAKGFCFQTLREHPAYTAWIDPAITYGFWPGIKHGFFAVQNGFISLFTGREYYAPLVTSGYRWGYWIGLFLIPGLIRLVFEVLGIVVGEWLR